MREMAKKKTKKKAVKKKAVKKKPAIDIRDVKTEPAPHKPKITPYPTAGPKVQEFEDLIDKNLEDDVTPKPKRPVGRPPGKKPQESEQPELTIDVVAGVIKIPFQLWSISQSVKSLELTDEEAKRIAEPAKQLLEYYLPKIPVIAYAWITMSVNTFWVMQVRLRTIKELKEHRKRIQQTARPAEPAPPGVETKFPSDTKTEKV